MLSYDDENELSHASPFELSFGHSASVAVASGAPVLLNPGRTDASQLGAAQVPKLAARTAHWMLGNHEAAAESRKSLLDLYIETDRDTVHRLLEAPQPEEPASTHDEISARGISKLVESTAEALAGPASSL